MVTATFKGDVLLWDLTTQLPIGPPLAHPAEAWWASFSADQRMMATASLDKLARVWRIPAPLEGDIAAAVRWAQIRTGLSWDSAGNLVVLDAAAWGRHNSGDGVTSISGIQKANLGN